MALRFVKRAHIYDIECCDSDDIKFLLDRRVITRCHTSDDFTKQKIGMVCLSDLFKSLPFKTIYEVCPLCKYEDESEKLNPVEKQTKDPPKPTSSPEDFKQYSEVDERIQTLQKVLQMWNQMYGDDDPRYAICSSQIVLCQRQKAALTTKMGFSSEPCRDVDRLTVVTAYNIVNQNLNKDSTNEQFRMKLSKEKQNLEAEFPFLVGFEKDC